MTAVIPDAVIGFITADTMIDKHEGVWLYANLETKHSVCGTLIIAVGVGLVVG